MHMLDIIKTNGVDWRHCIEVTHNVYYASLNNHLEISSYVRSPLYILPCYLKGQHILTLPVVFWSETHLFYKIHAQA